VRNVGPTWGTRWCIWLRHCATSWKVASSIPDGVTGIFHWPNPSWLTLALELTQPLTEMSTRDISWGVKATGAYGWQPYHFHVPIVLKSGSPNLLEPSGTVQTCNGIALPFVGPKYYKERQFIAVSTTYISYQDIKVIPISRKSNYRATWQMCWSHFTQDLSYQSHK
jgi:hypothetical protein